MMTPSAAVELSTHSTVNPDLIAKYRCEGPRYTSYPTALKFSEDFTDRDHLALLKDAGKVIAPLSIYVHLPFCRWLCYYCGCNKVVTKDPKASQRFLEYISREVEMVSQAIGRRRPVSQLHLGGGTPTYLDDAELTELIHLLSSHFNFEDSIEREYSIEIDPRTVDGDRLALLRGLGFNRLSFGVQDSNTAVQEAINRVYDVSELKTLFKQARNYRFQSIAVDLIYGLPMQNRNSINRTLDDVLELSPDRIAFYHYAHMPDRFPPQRAIDRLQLPSSEEKLAMHSLAVERFAAAGYVHIGMDHFVKPDDNLALYQKQGRLQRNFQGYSTCLAPDVLALGPSAISSIQGNFAQNHRDLVDYYQSLDEGHLPTARGLVCTEEDRLRGYVISQLICNLELDFAGFKRRYGMAFLDRFGDCLAELQALAGDGLLTLDDQGIKVTDTGRSFLRNICMIFDAYLPSNTGQEKNLGQYSKTL